MNIVVTPALRDGGEEPAMQAALEKRFPECLVEFTAPDGLHGRLSVYPSPAMREFEKVNATVGKPEERVPTAHMLVAQALKDWGVWY